MSTVRLCLALLLLALIGCSRPGRIIDAVSQTIEAVEGTQRAEAFRRPTDPPYGPTLILPSGLRLEDLARDATLTGSYPNPSALPFGGSRRVHYQPPAYFIDIPSLFQARRSAFLHVRNACAVL